MKKVDQIKKYIENNYEKLPASLEMFSCASIIYKSPKSIYRFHLMLFD